MCERIPGLPNDVIKFIATTPWTVSVLAGCSRGLRGYLAGWCVRVSSKVNWDEGIFRCTYAMPMHGHEWVLEYDRGVFRAITPARTWNNDYTNPHTCVMIGGGYFSGTKQNLRAIILDFFGPRRVAAMLVHLQVARVDRKPIVPRVRGAVWRARSGAYTVLFDEKSYVVTLSADGRAIVVDTPRWNQHIPCADVTTEYKDDLYVVDGRLYVLGDIALNIVANAYPVYKVTVLT